MNQKRFLDILLGGGICLLGMALLDGAIEGLEHVSKINLWKTCGIIGGVLLGGYAVLSVFERSSHLRRGLSWLAMRFPKRREPEAEAAVSGSADSATDSTEHTVEDEPPRWQPSTSFEDTTFDETPTDRFELPTEATSEVVESNGSVDESKTKSADVEELEAEDAESTDFEPRVSEAGETGADDFKIEGFDVKETESEDKAKETTGTGSVSPLPK